MFTIVYIRTFMKFFLSLNVQYYRLRKMLDVFKQSIIYSTRPNDFELFFENDWQEQIK